MNAGDPGFMEVWKISECRHWLEKAEEHIRECLFICALDDVRIVLEKLPSVLRDLAGEAIRTDHYGKVRQAKEFFVMEGGCCGHMHVLHKKNPDGTWHCDGHIRIRASEEGGWSLIECPCKNWSEL